jgi:hypothetical protein
VRVGANMLILQQREIHGIPLKALTVGARMQVDTLEHRQICLLTQEGCAWRSDPGVLRPDGWGQLQLGMSRQDIEEIGMARFNDTEECTSVEFETGTGLLSAADELVSITVPEGVTTPGGIGVGTSRDDILAQYLVSDPGGDTVLRARASPTADYEITIEEDRVSRLTLSTLDQECSG